MSIGTNQTIRNNCPVQRACPPCIEKNQYNAVKIDIYNPEVKTPKNNQPEPMVYNYPETSLYNIDNTEKPETKLLEN